MKSNGVIIIYKHICLIDSLSISIHWANMSFSLFFFSSKVKSSLDRGLNLNVSFNTRLRISSVRFIVHSLWHFSSFLSRFKYILSHSIVFVCYSSSVSFFFSYSISAYINVVPIVIVVVVVRCIIRNMKLIISQHQHLHLIITDWQQGLQYLN